MGNTFVQGNRIMTKDKNGNVVPTNQFNTPISEADANGISTTWSKHFNVNSLTPNMLVDVQKTSQLTPIEGDFQYEKSTVVSHDFTAPASSTDVNYTFNFNADNIPNSFTVTNSKGNTIVPTISGVNNVGTYSFSVAPGTQFNISVTGGTPDPNNNKDDIYKINGTVTTTDKVVQQ